MMSRSVVQAALDALAAGDTDEATRLLLDALEADAPRPSKVRCPKCGYADYPGPLYDHRRWVHGEASA